MYLREEKLKFMIYKKENSVGVDAHLDLLFAQPDFAQPGRGKRDQNRT